MSVSPMHDLIPFCVYHILTVLLGTVSLVFVLFQRLENNVASQDTNYVTGMCRGTVCTNCSVMSKFGIGITLKHHADNCRAIISMCNKSDVSVNVS
jgi:hypothetical protein